MLTLFPDLDTTYLPLETMSDEQFETLVKDQQLLAQAKIEQAQKEEELRKFNEAKQARYNERQAELGRYFAMDFLDRKSLTIESTDQEFNQLKEIGESRFKEHNDKIEAQRIENARLLQEREIAQKEAAKHEALRKLEQEKADKLTEAKNKEIAKLKKEKEEREAKEKAEAKAKLEAERKAAKLPELEKLTNWVNSFEISTIDTSKLSEAGKATVNLVQAKFEAFKDWAKLQVINLEQAVAHITTPLSGGVKGNHGVWLVAYFEVN